MRNSFFIRVTRRHRRLHRAGCDARHGTGAELSRAARADGKPNLNGIWQAINTANYDIEAALGGTQPGARTGGVGRHSRRPRSR